MTGIPSNSNDANAPNSRLEKLALPVLLLVGLLLYLPGLGSYGPLDPTDSFFIESGREIFETNQYLLPMFNYQTWNDKPILYFWMVAGCYKLLGVSAFAGRLASALSAVATGLVILQGTRRALGTACALTAALIFLSFPLVSVIGHESLTDMTLTLLMSASLVGFLNFIQVKRTWILIFAYSALGLAFLCKGPVAAVIVAGIVFAYLFLTVLPAFKANQFLPGLKGAFKGALDLKPGLGLLIMAVINVPWYWAASAHTNGAFLYDFFITQNFGRMAGKVNHLEPFWFYLPVIAGGLFPLNLLLFSRKKELREAFDKRLDKDTRSAMVLFSLVWAVLVLGLFGVLKTKLPTYILPAMPPLAVLTSVALFAWLRAESVKKMAPTGLLFVVAGSAGLVVPHLSKTSWVMVMLKEQWLLLGLTILTGVVYSLLLYKNRAREAFGILLSAAAVGVGVCVPIGHRVFYNEVHRPFEAMIGQAIADRAQIATVVTEEPSISYFLHRHVPLITTPAEARAYLDTAEKIGDVKAAHYLLVPAKCLKDMEWFPAGAVELSKIRKWTLFKLNEN
jgi:4-amino-4-deoxy-L-arabinose transferase-like glycosyltransferase